MQAPFRCLLSSLLWLATLSGLESRAVQSQVIAPSTETQTVLSHPGGNPNQFDISGGTRAGNNLFHSFQQFGLSPGQTVTFLSAPTIHNILGRITGGNASVINGIIQVSGSSANLFLVNPAGILFGPQARLNVPASFMATTADGVWMGHGWFNATGPNAYAALTGNPESFAFLGPVGAILNAGILTAPPGQTLTLLGGVVVNTGTLAVPGGTITIAAVPGQRFVRLSQTGNLLSLVLPTTTAAAINAPTRAPLSLPALLTGGTLPEATDLTVANGVVRLTSRGSVISTTAGAATVSGALSVAATTPADAAQIQVFGDRVALLAANLNASGVHGGTVFVGGGDQGQGARPLAQSTVVDALTQIQANALTQGEGGKVVIRSTGTTQVQGQLTATGGAQTGNGGFVETSGQQLDVTGLRVDASAPRGLPGTWVIDPSDITIATTGGTLTPTQLTTVLDGGTNVSLTTAAGTGGNGDLTLVDAVNQTGGGTAALTLTGRRFANPGQATIAMTSTGGLIVNLNQVNPEVNAPTSSIQNAINAIGAVAGTRVIHLGAGTYTGETITIDRSLTLNGSGANTTTISGNNADRVLNITTGSTVNLDGLTITKGKVDAFLGLGGGIANAGTLTLNHSILTENTAFDGGGLYNSGTVTVVNSALTSNAATYGGGLSNSGTATVSNSTLSSNLAFNVGGGIVNDGTLTLDHSSLTENGAFGGGGIWNGGTATVTNIALSSNWSMYGGSLLNGGTLTLDHSTLTGNAASVYSDLFHIGGFSFNFSGGGGIWNSGTVTMTNSTLSGNSARYGGGIINWRGTVTVANSTLSNNSARYGDGGGIWNGGTVTVANSTLSSNSARYSGGGIWNSGAVTVANSTLSSNASAADGGGIYNAVGGIVTVANSTLSGNSASSGDGGGIYNQGGYIAGWPGYDVQGGKVWVSNSTLSGNLALEGGGLYNSASRAPDPGVENRTDLAGTLAVSNSLITGNSADTAREVANAGIASSEGYNLFGYSGSSGVVGMQLSPTDLVPDVGLDRILAPLASNGGPTQTHALVPGSPAINVGKPSLMAPDQRSAARVGRADIGAFEFQGLALPSFALAELNQIAAALLGQRLEPLIIQFQTLPASALLCVDRGQREASQAPDLYPGMPNCLP
ncbi:MAG: filamentous hemagglutinin N-terminal domain-containing protein [Leptolyngbya sp. BL-A-14]